MSSREQLLHKTVEAIHSTGWLELAGDDRDVAEGDVAGAALGALLPQIFSPKQMVGVPDGSILTVETQNGARALTWDAMERPHGKLVGLGAGIRQVLTAKWVLENYGPLTVVWMP